MRNFCCNTVLRIRKVLNTLNTWLCHVGYECKLVSYSYRLKIYCDSAIRQVINTAFSDPVNLFIHKCQQHLLLRSLE